MDAVHLEFARNPTGTLVERLDHLCALEEEKERLDRELSEVGKACEALRLNVHEQMETDGCKFFKDEKGRSVRINEPGVFARVQADRQDAALAEIKGAWNAAYAVKETIHPSTLSRLVKERLEAGLPVPPDMFDYYIQKRLTLTRKPRGGGSNGQE